MAQQQVAQLGFARGYEGEMGMAEEMGFKETLFVVNPDECGATFRGSQDAEQFTCRLAAWSPTPTGRLDLAAGGVLVQFSWVCPLRLFKKFDRVT